MKKNTLTTISTIFFIAFLSTSFVFAGIDTGARHVGDVEKISITPDPQDWELQGSEWVWTYNMVYEGAHFLKFHFKNVSLPAGAVLELYDADMNLVISYTDEGPRDLGTFWGRSILSQEANLICISPVQPKNLFFEIDNFVPGEDIFNFESICGSNNLENINCKTRPTQVMNNKTAVAHIVFVNGSSSYVCTGSLVSSNNHFLTNNHCIPDQTTCNTMDVYFEYETSSSSSCTTNTASKGTAFSCDTFLTTSSSYDFGLMTLAGNPAGSRGHVNLNGKNLSTGEYLYIIQHPQGYPKKFADGTCFDNVTNGNATNSDCEYQIDTEGGSSGSPVFDSNGDVVALHHWGGCGSSSGNQGVLMSKIYPMIESYLGGTTTHTLKVTVNITHTYIGDLLVVLSTPSSQTITLHDHSGGSADNINTTYNVSGWDGDYYGFWTLKVSDHAGIDTGTLNSWSVEATPDGGSTHTESSSDTPITIPDNNATGITSTLFMY